MTKGQKYKFSPGEGIRPLEILPFAMPRLDACELVGRILFFARVFLAVMAATEGAVEEFMVSEMNQIG